MTNKYTLKKQDKQFLIEECFYQLEDLKQIQSTINKATFLLYEGDKRIATISPKQALELLRYDDFLTGVARAAFHYSAARITLNRKQQVYIENN